MRRKGSFGIGVFQPKFQCNIGTLFRTAYSFGADFVFTVGSKYRRQSADTPHSTKHVPYLHFQDWDEFEKSRPSNMDVVCVEIDEKAHRLERFCHPQRAMYLLGSESQGIPKECMKNYSIVALPGSVCVNVSVAGSIVLYDRLAKSAK